MMALLNGTAKLFSRVGLLQRVEPNTRSVSIVRYSGPFRPYSSNSTRTRQTNHLPPPRLPKISSRPTTTSPKTTLATTRRRIEDPFNRPPQHPTFSFSFSFLHHGQDATSSRTLASGTPAEPRRASTYDRKVTKERDQQRQRRRTSDETSTINAEKLSPIRQDG